MAFRERYEGGRRELLSDPTITKSNRELFREFFDWEERKLKRRNDLAELDEPSYKTLYGYLNRFRNVNRWFENKPWSTLTEDDIRRVYDDLEDGRIKTRAGKRFQDRGSYYTKVFKSKPFQLAGLRDKVANVLEFSTGMKKKAVRFIAEEGFKRMVSFLQKPQHFALFWLAWDIGENITSLLKLRVRHFKRQLNRDTQEPEYQVYLPEEALKRSRQTRSEPTLYPETVRYLDALFKYGKEVEYRDAKGRIRRKAVLFQNDDLLFSFGYRQALQIFDSVIRRSGVTCEPERQKPSWKDLRSGMACHLFAQGWHVEDINMRLGHSPQSKWLAAYVNHLAINRKRIIKKHYESNLEDVRRKLEESRNREKRISHRLERQQQEHEELRTEVGNLRSGKGFMTVLFTLAKQQQQMAEKLRQVTGKKFDVVLPGPATGDRSD